MAGGCPKCQHLGQLRNRTALGTADITQRKLLAVILRVPRGESRLFPTLPAFEVTPVSSVLERLLITYTE
jgi:hypothetical protein